MRLSCFVVGFINVNEFVCILGNYFILFLIYLMLYFVALFFFFILLDFNYTSTNYVDKFRRLA